MKLFPIFRWLELTRVGALIRGSTYLFPAIEVVHLLGLVLLLGTLLVVDLRLLGIGLRQQTIPHVSREFSPFTITGIVVMLGSGIPLFLSEAIKLYENQAFHWKMAFLLAALIFHFTVHRKVTSSDRIGAPWPQITAVMSLFLWFGIALCGRAIAFV